MSKNRALAALTLYYALKSYEKLSLKHVPRLLPSLWIRLKTLFGVQGAKPLKKIGLTVVSLKVVPEIGLFRFEQHVFLR